MELWTFLFAVLVLELTPGPNMAYLAILALARGRIAGLVATAGVATGLAVHAVVAGLGAGALIQQYPLLYETLRWIGVGYLLYLGADASALFMRGFLSNVFNPKSILFFVSVLPRFVGTEPNDPPIPIQMVVFGVLYVCRRRYRRSRKHCDTRRAIAALADRRAATADCTPHSVVLALVAIWLAWSTRR